MVQDYLMSEAFPIFRVYIPGILMFFIGWWLTNKVARLSVIFLRKVSEDSGIVTFLSSLLKFSLRIILVLVVMSNMGFNVSSIVAALTASLVAIGISLKDSLSNIVSGIVLVINKPIHVGDFIEFDGSSGTVMKIEMLFTTLKTDEEGKTVIIPNARLISNTVVRKSDYDISSVEKVYKIFGESFGNASAKRFLEKEFILSSIILQIPQPEIVFELDENGKAILKIKVWSQSRHLTKVSQVLEKIILKLESRYSIALEAEIS